MRARMCACACMRLRVGTGAQKKNLGCPREGNEGMKSHRFSGNLIKPSGDEDKTIQSTPVRLQEVRAEARSFDSLR